MVDLWGEEFTFPIDAGGIMVIHRNPGLADELMVAKHIRIPSAFGTRA
ncbi:hypothetical protein [Modestobacter excelsi]|nr:hypothetical protein [Modestobacter excelsi]